jgi:mRNA-degrading endonuclease RelE of RelBE toxin-antitoxin system
LQKEAKKQATLLRQLLPALQVKTKRLPRYGNAVYNRLMIFIETSTFTKLLSGYLNDEEYRGLQTYLMQKPDAGDIVKGSGGVRKVRWAPDGKGKSGGVRVVYYWKRPDHEIWMLTLYSKSEKSTIPGHILKQIAEAIDHEQ